MRALLTAVGGRMVGASGGIGQIVVPLFTAAIFLSAFLLFVVQPMFAKMVLPKLGGAPAVWAVAMCFFQTTLLLGYAYAHWLIGRGRAEQSALIHLAVVAIAMLGLPLGLASGWDTPPTDGLYFWVFGLFAVSIGLPFFALSAQGPLLQAWYARSAGPEAGEPYFLYSASNLGSLLALLAYPVLFEPMLSLEAQTSAWSVGFGLLWLLLVGTAAVMVWSQKSAGAPAMVQTAAATSTAAISWHTRATWVGLAFLPSGLLTGVTNHISTDVAAAPFLWVIPLALYLLTFIITFQPRPMLSQRLMERTLPFIVAGLVLAAFLPVASLWLPYLVLHLVGFFVLAMVCHGALVARRPDAARLTEFYLCMSFGGMIGGVFAGLIAPQVFNTVAEYPLLIAAACLALPHARRLKDRANRIALMAALAAVAVAAIPGAFGIEVLKVSVLAYIVVMMAALWAVYLARKEPVFMAAFTAASFCVAALFMPAERQGETIRGFFGVHKITETADGQFRLLNHGTTLHGAMRLDAELAAGGRPEPLTYYHSKGGFADVIGMVQARRPGQSFGVVGLGAGSLACYVQPGERWKFYEIDPLVVDIARDPSQFLFLSRCAPDMPVILGDARLTVAAEPTGQFDLLIIDAFSSDVVPVHLLTLEAIRSYLEKLPADGVLVMHISNRNMALEPVVAAAAQALGLSGRITRGVQTEGAAAARKFPAEVVALARDPAHLKGLEARGHWRPLEQTRQQPWTDDYSNLIAAIWQRMTAPSRWE